MNAKLMFFGLLATTGLISANVANGQVWGNGFPYAPTCWHYGYSTYAAESIPYFALHPPVYYSYRVARTYGYSPFAYPPGVLTPSARPSRAAARKAPKPEPLRIVNPFVDQPDGPGVAQSPAPTGRKPQVVYPAALAPGSQSTENRSGHGR